jgi:nucleoside-diphosphate-sugar epimerase
MDSCFLTGGSSQIGSWLAPELVDCEWEVNLISRGRRPQLNYGPQAHWLTFDLSDRESSLPPANARVLFHTAWIATVLPRLGEFHARGVARLIAFGSTSRFTKVESESNYELEKVAANQRSEQELIEQCERLGIKWTIFRPTLVYGGKQGDRTVSDIVRVISHLGLFPLFGEGKGLRQPVFAQDLAKACVQALDSPATFGRSYNLGGGERLPYVEMVERIFSAMGRKPRFLRMPILAFELAARLARIHPRYRHITSSMARRMQQDMVFDFDDASRDFGYSPRGFCPQLAIGIRT